jgi:hypothetical protein
MLNVVMLSVVKLCVVAPFGYEYFALCANKLVLNCACSYQLHLSPTMKVSKLFFITHFKTK